MITTEQRIANLEATAKRFQELGSRLEAQALDIYLDQQDMLPSVQDYSFQMRVSNAGYRAMRVGTRKFNLARKYSRMES